MCEQLPAAGDEDQPLCEAFADVLVGQIHQNLTEEKTTRWELMSTICNDELSCYSIQTELYLSQKAFVFGEQTSTVLHGDI